MPKKSIIGNLIRQSDTPWHESNQDSRKAAIGGGTGPNLVYYKPLKVYFARAEVGGKLIRQSCRVVFKTGQAHLGRLVKRLAGFWFGSGWASGTD